MKLLFVAMLLIMSALFQNATLAVGQTNMTLHPIADNYVDSKYPDRGHYGKMSFLYVGNSYDHAQNIWGSERIFMRFNLTGLPKNHVIVRATLTFWQYNAPKSNQTYETHRVLGDWDETTQNWHNQPSWSATITSETVAPPLGAQGAEVPVEWDITSDVKAWYDGSAVNYGIMIKVADEEQSQNASSGFWSREYPQEGVEPTLSLVLQPEPTLAYVVTIGAEGLANGTLPTITIDGQAYGSLHPGRIESIALYRGTAHTIAVSKLVSGPLGVRYRCNSSEIRVSTDTSHIFIYSVEYLVTFSMEPSNLFQTPPTGWYTENATLAVNRVGADVINTGQGVRLFFDGWYMNSQKQKIEPTTVKVTGPIALEGRYTTEYFLNVTSSIGTTKGSGWYQKDSTASFSIDAATYPDRGFLGLLGVRQSFTRWTGSNDFLGETELPQCSVIMKEPTTVEPVWQEDWSPAIVNTSLVLITLIACILIAATLRRRSHKAPQRERVVWPIQRV